MDFRYRLWKKFFPEDHSGSRTLLIKTLPPLHSPPPTAAHSCSQPSTTQGCHPCPPPHHHPSTPLYIHIERESYRGYWLRFWGLWPKGPQQKIKFLTVLGPLGSWDPPISRVSCSIQGIWGQLFGAEGHLKGRGPPKRYCLCNRGKCKQ